MENVLEEMKSYWQQKVNVSYETGDADADELYEMDQLSADTAKNLWLFIFSHTTTMEKADEDGEISGRTVLHS